MVLISPCVITYDPVHVNVPPGANGCPAVGHVTVSPPPFKLKSSETRISDIVTFPVFVTTNEYDTRSPTRATVVRLKLFATDNPGADAIVTTPAEEPSDTVRPGPLRPPRRSWSLTRRPHRTPNTTTISISLRPHIRPGTRQRATRSNRLPHSRTRHSQRRTSHIIHNPNIRQRHIPRIRHNKRIRHPLTRTRHRRRSRALHNRQPRTNSSRPIHHRNNHHRRRNNHNNKRTNHPPAPQRPRVSALKTRSSTLKNPRKCAEIYTRKVHAVMLSHESASHPNNSRE